MRSIATCYSEDAVKVSDSYCSGPLNKSYISPKSIASIQNVVSWTYKAKISPQKTLFVTIKWCSKLICQGFFIKFSENKPSMPNSENGFQFHQLPKIKGTKSLDFDDQKSKFSVHWDLSAAKFGAGPQPLGGYYVVVLVDSLMGLVLGDMEDDPTVENLVKGLLRLELSLVSQCEHFIGLSNFAMISSIAKFCDAGVEHEIMIKCCPEDDGPRNPVLTVYIDKRRVVRIKRLQWNFRGNQVIFVDGLLVDVMWDVYGWYFDQTIGGHFKGGRGFFLFRTRSGLDSRLWLEEEVKKLADKHHDKHEFSLLICASSKNPS